MQRPRDLREVQKDWQQWTVEETLKKDASARYGWTARAGSRFANKNRFYAASIYKSFEKP